jgi:hypothetical protein
MLRMRAPLATPVVTGGERGPIEPYGTAGGKRYRVRCQKPDRTWSDKRGFRTKRGAELFMASVEVPKATSMA